MISTARVYIFFLLLALNATAWGQCSFTLNPTSAQAAAVASTGSFAVNATASTCPRSAGSNASWLTVTFGQTGTGNGSVGYRVDANPGYTTRSGAINVSGAAFTVTQAALPCPALIFSPLGQAVQPGGGGFSIAITSPCGWTAFSDASWIVLSANSGASSGSVAYSVAPNNSGAARTGNIQIGGDTFTVTQFSIDCTFTVAPLSVNVGPTGGQNQISVQVTNNACPWAVQNTTSWIGSITINGNKTTSSMGNGTIAYTVAANTSAQPRSASLTIANQQVTINQGGNVCTFTLSPPSVNVSYASVAGTFGIATSLPNCPWTSVSNNNWITVTSGAQGNAAGTVGYAIATNTSVQARSGSISAATSTFSVTQDACSSPYSFLPQSQAAPPAGGNFSVGVTTLCNWTATTATPWIALNAGSGTTGNGSLSYTVAPNNAASSRAGSIQINGQTFAVTQSGITASGGGIQFTAQSVVNGASFRNGQLAPGELITIFGSGLGPSQAVGLQTTPDGRYVTTSLGGTRVLFDGMAAPLTYVSATQVNAIVPFGLAGAVSTQVVVEVQGIASSAVTETVGASSPAIFAVAGGTGQGAVLNQDNRPNSAAIPAAVGSVLQVFATGIGQTNPAGSDGQIAGADVIAPVQKVTATIGGMDAPVQYVGSSNGLVSGVTQVNVMIPAGVQTGNGVPLVLNVAGNASSSGITVAIR